MKSVVNQKDQEKPFPKLMKSNLTGNVVFFQHSGKGQVVNSGKGQIGDISPSLGMENFTDFDGTVTLSND